MALKKISYEGIEWVNNSTHALNAENLNHMDGGIETVTDAYNLLVGTVDSDTSKINSLSDLVDELFPDNAGTHNSHYRGKSLGSSITSDQYAQISAGTFKDLYVGDYWTINGVNWRIANFDYYYRSGDTECTKHHIVIVPDSNLYNAQMNTSNVTTGGYVGSAMYTSNLATAKTTISGIFGSHLLTHREWQVNAVSNGRPSSGAWADTTVDLMTEEMVYGSGIFHSHSDGSNVPANYRCSKSQLSLFRHRPDLISNRLTYWLKDVVSGATFALVGSHGRADYYYASYSFGVRPAFCIC